ncbi:MAG: hypothetical protein HPY69_05935 [Armatimonadetes bacterium]|nr:hypothetical protein [Armatimonadota bacterium]
MYPALLLCLFVACALSAASAATIYVAPNGRDTNPGTAARPLATLEGARDVVRSLQKTGPVTVEIAGGVYELKQPLEFGAADSGTEQAPIEYRAREGQEVRLVGGRTVTGWRLVSDPAVLRRLSPLARGKVFQADLKALGITDLQGINSAQTYQSDPGLELFFRDQPMTLARYPNTGYMRIAAALDAEGKPQPAGSIVTTPNTRFVCEDPRPATWASEKDIWLHGFWVWDWADLRVPLLSVDAETRTISLGDATSRSYGIRTGQWFYAENVLPELDSPGEWYLDRDTGILYFWPPAPLSRGKAVVSVVRDLIRLTDVSHVTFRGLTVEAGRGQGFIIRGGSNVRVVGCTIRNMGNWAVKVYGGTQHGVVGCDITQTGQGGIHLEGGDRKTLTPAGHYADNNHIHHTSRWDPVYQQGIALYGVGNRATHNLIDNVPHIAIGFSHNDMTIEYNEIHSSVFQSNDAGAIYTSPPDETWSMRGHKIRYNYLHNIHGFEGRGCMGVYLDDCFSSADISSNIFYDVATAILIGGGRDNLITNNLFLNCGRAFSIDARGLGWAKGVGVFATQELHDLNYTKPPWSVKYPELLGILEDDPLAPKGNVVARNICWGGPWGWIEGLAQPLVKVEDNLTDEDPRLTVQPPAGFRLAPDSPAHKIGFRPIPFRRIGLYESPDRASWPVVSTLRKDPRPPAPKPKPVRKAGPPPVFDIPRRLGAISIDGQLEAAEWFGLQPSKGLLLQEGVQGEKVRLLSRAWLAWDDEALYVAFDNQVSPDTPMAIGDAWGSSDAVEVAIRDAAWGEQAPILVLRGFPTGTFVSSDEAGAPPEVVKRAGEGVQYAARVVDSSRWVAELRVPFSALGFTPRPGVRYPFNLSVRKQGADPWVEWRGTGAQTWYVPGAGLVRFAPPAG